MIHRTRQAIGKLADLLHRARYNADGPKGGLRITNDEDRDFYRLVCSEAFESRC